MDGAWLARVRWRRRGAWLWPVFAAAIAVDALIGYKLPPTGETQSLMAAALLACVLNLIAVLLLSRPLGALLRRARPDLPVIVARNHAGTLAVLAVAAVLLVTGLAHHPTVVAHRRDMRDATARAQAWIGDRAPAEFRRHVERVNTFAIEPGRVYRTCVSSYSRTRSYCVIVDTRLPLTRGVRFDGYEPNATFAAGAG